MLLITGEGLHRCVHGLNTRLRTGFGARRVDFTNALGGALLAILAGLFGGALLVVLAGLLGSDLVAILGGLLGGALLVIIDGILEIDLVAMFTWLVEPKPFFVDVNPNGAGHIVILVAVGHGGRYFGRNGDSAGEILYLRIKDFFAPLEISVDEGR